MARKNRKQKNQPNQKPSQPKEMEESNHLQNLGSKLKEVEDKKDTGFTTQTGNTKIPLFWPVREKQREDWFQAVYPDRGGIFERIQTAED